MKNILYLLSLALILIGCEKYELPSDPQLNINGWWDVVDINVVIDEVNYDSEIEVLSEDQASVSAFVVTGQDSSGNLLLTQNFEGTDIKRRFDIDYTQWEFDYGSLRITDSLGDQTTTVDFPCTYCTESTVMYVGGNENRYTFSIDTYGAMPSNVLKLTSQTFYTNIMVNNNQYDKAIVSHLEITLHRL